MAHHTPLLLLALAAVVTAQTPIDPAGLPGTRFLVGGGKAPEAVYERFVTLCGGADARIVLIPTASRNADTEEGRAKTLTTWRGDHPDTHFEVLHTRDRAVADEEAFTAPLRAATGVWLGGGAQELLAAAYLGTRVERELVALLARGGVVGGTSAGTAIQTRPMIQEGMNPPVIADGFDFVPGAISDQHFLVRERLPRLLLALAARPGHFGLGIDEGTAVEIAGREMRVLGRSKALLVLAAGAGREQRIVELQAGDRADLVTWQRAARDRAAEAWPPAELPPPAVPAGSLVIVGGGRLPDAALQRFVELAGGAAAKVVLVPSAMAKGDRAPEPIARRLRAAGVGELRELDCAHPRDVTDTALAVLDDATAVWFGGGRQWRLCDAFEGTAALAKFHGVLTRGGVIGGSSAGATIQGGFLVRGNPLGNTEMWCEGYDRGFAFLPGCAIDQHFLARDRLGDLAALHRRLPQLTGLGIDEGTAAIVAGDTLEVVGDSRIALFAPRAEAPVWLEPGQRWSFRDSQRR